MHLAAAVGTPVVAIFGPSDPARYATIRSATIASSASICPAAPAIAFAARRHDASATRRTASSHVSADAVHAAAVSVLAAARGPLRRRDPAMNDVVIAVRSASGRREVRLADYLPAAAADRAADDAMAWIKRLRHARVDGDTLRRRFTYRDDSLWWFAELYLHKQQVVAGIFRTIAALEHLLAREAPGAIEIVRRGVGTTTPADRDRGAADRGRGGRRLRRPAHDRRLEPSPRRDGRAGEGIDRGRARVARCVRGPSTCRPQRPRRWHSCTARSGAGRRGTAATKPTSVRYSRRSSGNWEPPTSATSPSARRPTSGPGGGGMRCAPRDPGGPAQPIETFAPLTPPVRLAPALAGTPSHAAGALRRATTCGRWREIRGCDCWPLIREELAGVALLQWPWSARAMDEAGAALDTLQPRVAVTYAEAGGWGRAIVLECRRRRIPSVGLQHGFIYRHWLNYLHEADEMQADGDRRAASPPRRRPCSSTTTPPITSRGTGDLPPTGWPWPGARGSMRSRPARRR